jgi:hypothetical protein
MKTFAVTTSTIVHMPDHYNARMVQEYLEQHKRWVEIEGYTFILNEDIVCVEQIDE